MGNMERLKGKEILKSKMGRIKNLGFETSYTDKARLNETVKKEIVPSQDGILTKRLSISELIESSSVRPTRFGSYETVTSKESKNIARKLKN